MINYIYILKKHTQDIPAVSRTAVVGLREFYFNPVVMLVFGKKWSVEISIIIREKVGSGSQEASQFTSNVKRLGWP